MRPLGEGEAPILKVRVNSLRHAQVNFLAELHGQSVSEYLRSAIEHALMNAHSEEIDGYECPIGHLFVPMHGTPERGDRVICVNDLGRENSDTMGCGFSFVWDESGALLDFTRNLNN